MKCWLVIGFYRTLASIFFFFSINAAGSTLSLPECVDTGAEIQCTVKDSASNLAWMYDWGVSGSRNRAEQIEWAEQLNYAGYSDWEIPTMQEFYSLHDAVDRNLDRPFYDDLIEYFLNVEYGSYWSISEDDPGFSAWALRLTDFSPESDKVSPQGSYFGVAVRRLEPGTVPEPSSIALIAAAALVSLLGRVYFRFVPGFRKSSLVGC